MKIINIGIVAHVDAGKTSLTERLLYETNVIDEVGRVDKGNTQTDSLELERKRGITIKASVVSFFVKDVKVNLIDTPGHADFIAEVERSLSVLDGVVLVISAVEGVQAQTKILMSVLQKLRIPTILFVNKIDRVGAQSGQLIESIKEKLTKNILPLYTVEHVGTKQASITENFFNTVTSPAFVEECIELIASDHEALFEAYVNDEEVTEQQLRTAIQRQISDAKLYPVYFGSAMTGTGVAELLEGVVAWFPVAEEVEEEAVSAVVFKIDRETSGEKVAYVRIFSGSLSVRESVKVQRNRGEFESDTVKVKKICEFVAGKAAPVQKVAPGDFCKVWGLENVQIGDTIGEKSDKLKDVHFATPQMETRIEARNKEQNHQLYEALINMSEEDPLIKIFKDDTHQEIYIRIFGEVQKEVIETMLQDQYGVDVLFSETRVICIEKPKGTGQAFEMMGAADNPFYATVGFRVEPGLSGSGIVYQLEVELGSLLLSFHKAIEETVYDTLKQGLYGWEVTDIVVTLTHTGYDSVLTVAGDFRKLVPLVLMKALKQAGTDVYEPINKFELSVPATAISKAMLRLSSLKAVFQEPVLRKATYILTGTLPMAATEGFQRGLHAISEGEGVMIVEPDGYTIINSEFPTRERTDFNPLNRREYLLHVSRAY